VTVIYLLMLIAPALFASEELKSKLIVDKISEEISKISGVQSTTSIVTVTPTPVATLDPVAEKLEMMKAKVREEIARRQQQKKANNKKGDWVEQKKAEIDGWIDEKKKQIAKWEEERGLYLKRIPQYKENLISFSAYSNSVKESAPPAKLPTAIASTPVTIIPYALELKVADQGKRPTCAAFAATRAIEIIREKNGNSTRLSPQYFYWASKPDCQKEECSEKGSWVTEALKRSKNSTMADIPTLEDCPYNPLPKAANETQIPLNQGCFRGSAKVINYTKIATLEGAIAALQKGAPVIAGVRLDEEFYNNRGIVFLKNQTTQGKTKSEVSTEHMQGHAILLVGVMELPPKLWGDEGKQCFLTVNSWGEGWGVGGHSCISFQWLKSKLFQGVDFISVNEAQ